MQKTTRLYYEDPYLTQFEAQVVCSQKCDEGYWLKLDKSAFYPTSGGQPNDLGKIAGINVLDVVEEDGDVLHLVEALPQTSVVHCEIDWQRRYDFMQQHAGQHVLSSVFEKLFDADTVGFHLTERSLTVDLSLQNVSEQDMSRAEDAANSIVQQNRRITPCWPTEAELAKMPLRKPPPQDSSIRIVVVEDLDFSPCGGTHPKSCSEIGIIKILDAEKVRQTTRLHLACGNRARTDYHAKNDMLKSLCAALSSPMPEVTDAVRRLLEQNHSYNKRIEQMSRQMVELESELIVSNSDGVVSRYYQEREPEHLRMLALAVCSNPGMLCVLGTSAPRPQIIVSRSEDVQIDVRMLIETAKQIMNGKGGGNPKIAQAGSQDGSAVERAVHEVTRRACDLMLRHSQ